MKLFNTHLYSCCCRCFRVVC